MQQLGERRLTDTPRDIPHVPGNCGLSSNSPEGRGSVAGLSTSPNNPDAALTPLRREKEDSLLVFVLNKHGKPLMPCSCVKARLLLKQGKAVVVKRTPFTIGLLYGSYGHKQPVTLGVDTGYSKGGLSAVKANQELYAAEVSLRTDLVKLNSERRQNRRSRRYRKTWYRKPRFLNRRKPEGWLAPSVHNKLTTQVKVIHQIGELLPVSEIVVEVAAFDIQRINDPDISGVDYQSGPQKDFWNVREYVLYRDGHICQLCFGKSKDPVLQIHHIESRQTGGNRPDNLTTLCKTCHALVSKGDLALEIKPSRGFKAETFMTTVRWKLINQLRDLGYNVRHTYGYIAKGNRIAQGLEKSHVNDAFVIAGGSSQRRSPVQYLIRQVRKCNRKLFRGDRSQIRNVAPRFIYGFQRFDKVLWKGTECFIFGRRTTGYFALKRLDGTSVGSSAKAKECCLLERATTLLVERRMPLLPTLTDGVSAA